MSVSMGRILSAGALVVCTGLTAISDAAVPPASAAYSVPALVALAEQNNKALQAARLAVDISRARLAQAGLRSNPRLEVGARSGVLVGEAREYEASVGITQDFPVAGRLLRQKDVARVDVALAEAEVAEAERQQAANVAASAYRLHVLDLRALELEKIIAGEQSLVSTVRKRFKAAEVSEMDVNTVRLELQRRQQELGTVEVERRATLGELNGDLGRPVSQPLILAITDDSTAPAPDLARLQSLALERRADWHKALLQVDRASAELALAHSLRWEDWSLTVGVAQDRQVIDGAPPQGPGRLFGVSVSIPLPFYNKGQGRVAEALAVGDQARALLEAQRFAISNEVAIAYAQLRDLRAALALARESFPLTQRNVFLARLGYSQGLLPVYDVVLAQRQQAESYARYLDLLEKTLAAEVRLGAAVGDPYVGTDATTDRRG